MKLNADKLNTKMLHLSDKSFEEIVKLFHTNNIAGININKAKSPCFVYLNRDKGITKQIVTMVYYDSKFNQLYISTKENDKSSKNDNNSNWINIFNCICYSVLLCDLYRAICETLEYKYDKYYYAINVNLPKYGYSFGMVTRKKLGSKEIIKLANKYNKFECESDAYNAIIENLTEQEYKERF